jgi:hypothetical protein
MIGAGRLWRAAAEARRTQLHSSLDGRTNGDAWGMSKPGSKYHPLFIYLRERGQDEITLTFAQIEKVLGEALPEGARIERGWWSNRRRASPQAEAWLSAGYKVAAVDHQAYRYRRPRGGARYQLLFPLVRVNFELGVIMVIAVSCVKLLSAHNSTQHTSRKHKV